MPREIERKFLLTSEGWRAQAERCQRMTQGYIAASERTSVRVRIAGDDAWLNIKSGGLVASRLEYEYRVTPGPWGPHGGMTWEVDEFHGDNSGLVVAELELEREDQAFARPPWAGAEVTHLPRYYNVSLVNHPYRQWTAAERNP
jgi:adenylate cyclase